MEGKTDLVGLEFLHQSCLASISPPFDLKSRGCGKNWKLRAVKVCFTLSTFKDPSIPL